MFVEGYSDFSLEAPGCSPGVIAYSAHFKLDTDVTDLFPYINAVAEDTTYYDEPHHIQFSLEGFKCALYPDKAVMAVFENREQALRLISHLIDFLNDLHARTPCRSLIFISCYLAQIVGNAVCRPAWHSRRR